MAAALTKYSGQNQQVRKRASLHLGEIAQHHTECVCSTTQQEPEVKVQLDHLWLSLSEQEQVVLISYCRHDGRQNRE